MCAMGDMVTRRGPSVPAEVMTRVYPEISGYKTR